MPIGYWDSSANDGNGCYIDYSTYGCTNLDYTGSGDHNGLTYYNGDPANGYYSGISNSYALFPAFFVNGVATSLDSCGTGYWSGSYYVDGSANESAWSSCANMWVYQGSTVFGVDSSGNGWASTTMQYFIGGAPTSLDSMGSGFWNNHAYYSGSQQPNGWNGYYWYINDQQTNLDSLGNGTWNGVTYAAGVAQIVGTRFVGAASGDWNDVSNWRDAASNAATLLPDGNSTITVVAPISQDTSYAASAPNMIVEGSGTYVSISLTILTGGKALFRNGAYLGFGASISGDVEFADTAYMESGASVTGNATFRGRSVNKANISGTVTGAHGGGINGSNILGFA
jgi:hypothetical protein